MDSKSERLEQNEIISIQGSERILLNQPTFKTSELIDAIKISWMMNSNDRLKAWFYEGVKCEILTPGKNWRTGRVRLSLEFLPDEPEIEETPANNGTKNQETESPLDDLRQMMNQENS